MVELIISWIEVKVEMSKELLRSFVSDFIASGLWMPSLSIRELFEGEPKKLLINVHGDNFDVFGWEVFFNLIFIYIEHLFLVLSAIESVIPLVHLCFWVTSDFSLEICQFLLLNNGLLAELLDESILEILYCGWIFCHSTLKNHF